MELIEGCTLEQNDLYAFEMLDRWCRLLDDVDEAGQRAVLEFWRIRDEDSVRRQLQQLSCDCGGAQDRPELLDRNTVDRRASAHCKRGEIGGQPKLVR